MKVSEYFLDLLCVLSPISAIMHNSKSSALLSVSNDV